MADLYYCVKCKTKREMKDPQKVTMKNGKPALKGQCSVCGNVTRLVICAVSVERAKPPSELGY